MPVSSRDPVACGILYVTLESNMTTLKIHVTSKKSGYKSYAVGNSIPSFTFACIVVCIITRMAVGEINNLVNLKTSAFDFKDMFVTSFFDFDF